MRLIKKVLNKDHKLLSYKISLVFLQKLNNILERPFKNKFQEEDRIKLNLNFKTANQTKI